jgi:hypothetical protein
MAFEPGLAEKWLYTTLSQDGTIQAAVSTRVYNADVPGTASRPYIVFSNLSGTDALGGSNTRMFDRLLYLIEVIFEGSSLVAHDATQARIDTLLHGATNVAVSVSGGSGIILNCKRIATSNRVEYPQGVRINHRGGTYELLVRSN